MKKKLGGVLAVLSFAPSFAFAAAYCGATGTIPYIICTIGNILNSVIPILVILAIIYFIWGVITYVIAHDEEAKSAGRNRMIFGIIGLAVIVAVWGLVNILLTTFGVSNPGTPTLPSVPLQ